MHRRRAVFKNYPDPDNPDFFEKISSVIQLLARDGVPLELISDESSRATMLHQITWQSDDSKAGEALQTELAVVRDMQNQICYASIDSKPSWISKKAREYFQQNIECYTINELIQACSRRFFQPELLIALGLLGRKPDADMIRTIQNALDHDNPRVRAAAARAAAITTWQAFIPDIEVMLKLESDPTARKIAEHALEICARQNTR